MCTQVPIGISIYSTAVWCMYRKYYRNILLENDDDKMTTCGQKWYPLYSHSSRTWDTSLGFNLFNGMWNIQIEWHQRIFIRMSHASMHGKALVESGFSVDFFVLLGGDTTVASESESMTLITLSFIQSEWIRDENATNQPQNSTPFAMEYLSVFKCSPDLLAIVYCSNEHEFLAEFRPLMRLRKHTDAY